VGGDAMSETGSGDNLSDHTPPADGQSEAKLASLLGDLETLRQYLDERGRHTYELAQRFLDNARRDSSSRAYDERQATMLEYQQHSILSDMNFALWWTFPTAPTAKIHLAQAV
jgi:hypothetical protein